MGVRSTGSVFYDHIIYPFDNASYKYDWIFAIYRKPTGRTDSRGVSSGGKGVCVLICE